MGALTLTANTASAIALSNSGTALNLVLGNIARTTPSTIDITFPAAGAVTTTFAQAPLNGILVGAANQAFGTANGGATWVEKGTSGPAFALTAFSAYSTGNANYLAANNIDVTNGDSVSGVTVNTLRFNAASGALTLAGTNIVTTGGILVTPTGTGSSITGGTLTSSTGAAEVILHDYSTLNVGSVIANANAGATATRLTSTGTGTTTLSGPNTYTGVTTVLAGSLKAGVASVANVSGAFGNNSAVVLANKSGATLDITGFSTQIGSLAGGGSLGGTVTLGSATLTIGGDNTSPSYSGFISGTGNLTKIGTGTQTLNINGSTSLTGGFGTTVNGGTLNINAANTGGTNSGTPNFTVNGSTMTVNIVLGPTTFVGATNYLGTGGLTIAGGAYLQNASSSTGTQIQGFSSLTLGAGSSFFTYGTRGSSSGSSTSFGSVTRVAGGIAEINGTGAFGTNGAQSYGLVTGSTTAPGYLTISGNDWLAGRTTVGQSVATTYVADAFAAGNNTNVTLGTDTVVADVSTSTVRFNTAIAGQVTISGGVTLTVTNGGILMGSTVGTNNSTITGGSITSGNGNDLILINNDTTASGGSLIINSNITGAVGITAGQTTTTAVPGQIQLGGSNNTFSGPSYIDGGTVVLTNAGAWNGQSALNFAPRSTLASAGTFALNGNSITVSGLATTQTGLNPVVENAIGASVSNAILTVNLASGSNTYGGTLVNGTGGGTLALTKSGAGTQTLTGANTYTGPTTVTGGTLRAGIGGTLSTNGATGLGDVAVQGGTLDSNLSNVNFSGSVALSSGTIDPNATSVGSFTLNAAKSFTMSGGSFKLDLATVSSFDRILATASAGSETFSISGGTLALAGFSGFESNTFQIFGSFDSGTVSGLTITGYDTSNYNASLSTSGVLSFQAVPEPSAFAMMLGGLGTLVVFQRRRRKA